MESTRPDLNVMCRLCLKQDSQRLYHIFDEGLSNKIIILSGLDVQQNDALPKKVCLDCRYQLEKSYYFREKSKQCDSRIRKHIRLVNQNKPSNILDKDYRDDDTEEFDEMYLESFNYFSEAEDEILQLRKKFEAYKEKIVQEEVKNLELKLRAEYEIKTNALKNPIVPSPKRVTRAGQQIPSNPVLHNKLAPSNQRFQDSPTIVRRNISKEEPTASSSINEITLAEYDIEILPQSGDIDESQQMYELPGQYETNDQIQSTTIEFVNDAEYAEELEENLEEPADSDEEYKPVKREKKRPSLVVFKQTPARTKKNSKVPARVFKTSPMSPKKIKLATSPLKEATPEPIEEYFKAIEDTDTGDLDENGEKKIFQCAFENCSEAFARRQACKTHFYNHLASQTVENGMKCVYCQKTFKVASALERHERVHTGDKPFICDEDGCGKAFSQKEMLKRHKVIHLSIEDAPFSCNMCDKKFRQKEPLRLHINKIHSEDAESKSHLFSCSICQKKFAHSSGLSRHLLIHSGRRFICEVCRKVFNDQSALKRHHKVHVKKETN